jgi:dTDP-3,4-didehydro-2,6-dideoxy-alpha-D-glucose 3-reductase
MTISIGLAGCGTHALRQLLPLLTHHQSLRLAAVWTRNPQTQARLLAQGIPRVYGDFGEFLGEEMDVVYIATPTGCHFEHAQAVLESGHHAWVEKPLVTNLADAITLTQIAASRQLMLAEAFMFAWHIQAQTIKDVLAQMLVGTPRALSLTFCFPHLPDSNFRYNPVLGGGALLDHGCYLLKALQYYFPGNWQLAGGCLLQGTYPVDVSGAATLRRLDDGLIANLHWGFGHAYVNEMQIIGTHGRLLVESAFTKPVSRSCHIKLEDAQGKQSIIAVPNENAFDRMLTGFTQQFHDPASWPLLNREILAHAKLLFAVQAALQTPEANHLCGVTRPC